MVAQIRIADVYAGNTVYHLFRLRIPGRKGNWDVSSASWIALEWETDEGVVQSPIQASPFDPGADWSDGAVQIRLGADGILAQPGTKRFALTVAIDSQVITAVTGDVEASPRPGYPHPEAPPSPSRIWTGAIDVQASPASMLAEGVVEP
jgi:hypothetical protein